jgi:hypothetical protein
MNEAPTGPADEPFIVRDTARSEVLHRHARLSKNGRPVFCTPSRAERAGIVVPRQGSGTDGKVIYPTREAAEAAARELERLGARTLRAYLCGRSRGPARGRRARPHARGAVRPHPAAAPSAGGLSAPHRAPLARRKRHRAPLVRRERHRGPRAMDAVIPASATACR